MTAATPLPDLPADRDVTPTVDGTVTPGSHDRLGATVTGDGVDFAVFAKHASGVELVLFDGVDDIVPARIVVLDPIRDRTGAYWHVHVAGLGHGQLYGYRVNGPWAPHDGLQVRRDEGAPRSIRAGGRDTGGLPTGGRRRPVRGRGPDEERRRRWERLRLGGRPADRAPVPPHGHL